MTGRPAHGVPALDAAIAWLGDPTPGRGTHAALVVDTDAYGATVDACVRLPAVRVRNGVVRGNRRLWVVHGDTRLSDLAGVTFDEVFGAEGGSPAAVEVRSRWSGAARARWAEKPAPEDLPPLVEVPPAPAPPAPPAPELPSSLLAPWELHVDDPEAVPAVFTPTIWRVLRDGVAPVTVLLSPLGAWTQLPNGVAEQLLDRGPGGTGRPPRGLVYLLAKITEARWSGPFDIRATPRVLANTVTWSAVRLIVEPSGQVRPAAPAPAPKADA